MSTALSGAAQAAVCAIALCFASASAADDCPSIATAKGAFVVERGPDSKTEVFSGNGPIVRSVLRYRGQTVLETTHHEGIFELDRLDRGRRFVLKPKADLAKALSVETEAEDRRRIRPAAGRRQADHVAVTSQRDRHRHALISVRASTTSSRSSARRPVRRTVRFQRRLLCARAEIHRRQGIQGARWPHER